MLQILLPMVIKSVVTTITAKEAIATAAATTYVYDKLNKKHNDNDNKKRI